MSVYYRDYNGLLEPLSRLYWSSSSRFLVSRHPCSSIEEVLSSYCPQCLTRYMDDEVATYENRCPSCFQCPRCGCILTVVSGLSTDGVASVKTLLCGFCAWRSDKNLENALIGEDKAAIETSIIEFERDNPTGESFKAILQSLKGEFNATSLSSLRAATTALPLSSSSSSSVAASADATLSSKLALDGIVKSEKALINMANESGDNRWHIKDVEDMLEAKSLLLSQRGQQSTGHTNGVNHSSSQRSASIVQSNSSISITNLSQRLENEKFQSQHSSSAIPTRVRLMTKRTLRCRYDVENGKMSILVQPKSFPLEGDSSLKIQRGKWWVKDSSAVHEVPAIVVTKLPVFNGFAESGNSGGGARTDKDLNIYSVLHLKVTNPKDTDIQIALSLEGDRSRSESKDGEVESFENSSGAAATMQSISDPIKNIKHRLIKESRRVFSADKSLCVDSARRLRRNNQSCIRINDIVHEQKIVKAQPALVGNESNSLRFTLAAFEDELLRDSDVRHSKDERGERGESSHREKSSSSDNNCSHSSSGNSSSGDLAWSYTISNNMANVAIPFTIRRSQVVDDTSQIAIYITLSVLTENSSGSQTTPGGAGFDVFDVVIAFPLSIKV